jgi:hypothetical protein
MVWEAADLNLEVMHSRTRVTPDDVVAGVRV